jgi:dGTPase
VPDEARAECALLKAVAAHYVMRSQERRAVMGSQREIIETLVAAYLARPERLDRDLAPDFAAASDDAARLRTVVDQVASLTDARAWSLWTRWRDRAE